jgi:pentatricopeptide repeat protein
MKVNVKLDAHVYNVALMACRKQGMWAQAMQLLWEMESCNTEVLVQSYNHVIFACEEAG